MLLTREQKERDIPTLPKARVLKQQTLYRRVCNIVKPRNKLFGGEFWVLSSEFWVIELNISVLGDEFWV